MKTKTTFLQRTGLAALAIGTAAMAITLAPTVTHAQLVVWNAGTNFDSEAVGPYGTTTQFGDTSSPRLNIVTPGMGGTGNAMELTWNQDGTFINFQSAGIPYAATGNTNILLANYNLEFDMKVTGIDAGPYPQGFQISIFGPGGSVFSGPKVELDLTTNVFLAGQGYQHYSFSLDQFTSRNFDTTATNFTVGFGIVSFGAANTPVTNETLDIDNLQITMRTNNIVPVPHPTMSIVPARRGLRIFQQAADAFSQEGFATVDFNQSWVGLATPSTPVSYAITFQDFDTVANYTMNVQFVPGVQPSGGVGPYIVYNNPNDFLWRITSRGGTSGFTTSLAFKTNSPSNSNGGETNVVLATMATTSTNGRGTWTLTFTSDTSGSVTAPDGTSASFVLDPNMTAQFANPMVVCFGTSAGATGGFGQFTDISKIAVTNVGGFNENDDFTSETNLDPTVWDTSFSLNAGSVILVTSAPSYWVNWGVPDTGFGLETKAGLSGGTNVWFSPNYYGSGSGSTNTTPTLMGTALKWSWVPNGCLPTVGGTVGGAHSPNAFFRLASPPPSQ